MRKGFTLIETIIYAALISITIGLILLAVFQIIEARYRSLARVEIEEETNFLVRKIAWVLSGISVVNQPGVNATSTTLSVNKINFGSNPIVIQATSSNMTISYGNGSSTTLNSASVSVQSLVFQQVGSSSNPGITVNMTIKYVPRYQLTIYNATSSIQTTIYARKQ